MALKGVYLNFNGYRASTTVFDSFITAYQYFQKIYPGWKCNYNSDGWGLHTSPQITKMLAANASGIRNGTHALDGTIVANYLATKTSEEYYQDKVKAAYDYLISDGLTSGRQIQIPTGECPSDTLDVFGTHNDGIQLYFKKTGGIFDDPAKSNCYLSSFFQRGNAIIGRVEANYDRERSCFSKDYLLEQLNYCKNNSDVLVITGHELVPDGTVTTNALNMEYSLVHLISRFVCCNGLSFYTAEDILDNGLGQIGTQQIIPYVSIISVSGTQSSGNNLTATYTYADDDDTAESGTTFQWYRADDSIGTNSAAIVGATSLIYTLTGSDTGKYVRIGITPRAIGPQVGYEVFTKWFAIS